MCYDVCGRLCTSESPMKNLVTTHKIVNLQNINKHLLLFVLLGAVNAEPESCSAYKPYGHF